MTKKKQEKQTVGTFDQAAYHEAWKKMQELSKRNMPQRIPVRYACILWNVEYYTLIKDVTILDSREIRDSGTPGIIDHKSITQWDCTGGSFWRNWGSKTSRYYHDSPEGLFGTLCIQGFLNPYEALKAIYEFAKISSWARKMIRNGLCPGD